MKWYVFNDKEGNATVNVILDHNTTANVAYNSTGSNSEMKEVADALKKDTSTWKNTARLITANEVAKITGYTSWVQILQDIHGFISIVIIKHR
ncbi:MAG: hypothetical protein V8Q71_03590 [Bacilli bacterium]